MKLKRKELKRASTVNLERLARSMGISLRAKARYRLPEQWHAALVDLVLIEMRYEAMREAAQTRKWWLGALADE
jgi:hypothetical protein